MNVLSDTKFKEYRWKELIFQVILHVVVFIFYSFDKNQPKIAFHQFVLFGNYVVAVLLINYLVLPRLFYKKKYIAFLFAFLLIAGLVIVIEEFVIEKIYFPDTRGRHFQGVFYGMLDVLPIITILSGMKFAWDLIQKQTEVEVLKASMEESELSFLKSQLNPHFLFNNLNNLYSYALENSPKTPAIILELSSVLRYMLYECKEKYVPLRNELEQLRNFVKLNQLQIEERGEVTFNAPEVAGDLKIAPLILMVFIENAFKHSTASQKDKIIINIDIVVSADNQLSFNCRNSYEGQTNNESLSKGIGLVNVKKRLTFLYPEKHELTIEKGIGIYHVLLKMKLNS